MCDRNEQEINPYRILVGKRKRTCSLCSIIKKSPPTQTTRHLIQGEFQYYNILHFTSFCFLYIFDTDFMIQLTHSIYSRSIDRNASCLYRQANVTTI